MTSLVGAPPPAGHTIGAGVLARALKHHGVSYMFGVVGIPIVEVSVGVMQEECGWSAGCLSWDWSDSTGSVVTRAAAT